MVHKGTIQERITAFWSSIASGYEGHKGNVPARDSEEYRLWVAALAEMLPPAPSDVLDVGTGTGFLALIAARLGHRVTAIDLSNPMLNEANRAAVLERLSVRFLKDDAISPSLAPGSFDAIMSRHLIWTLHDPISAFANWRRLLKPGGRIVAIDGFWFLPAHDGEARDEGYFESFYTKDVRKGLPGWQFTEPQQIAALAEKAGLTKVSICTLDEIQRVALNPPSDTPAYALSAFGP